MGPSLIPALILIALLVVGFLAWELYFSKRGQRAMADQNREDGKPQPPKNF